MVTRVKTEVAPPTQARLPPVNSLQSTSPVTPSGWVNVWIKMYCGRKNVANVMSATARFKRR